MEGLLWKWQLGPGYTGDQGNGRALWSPTTPSADTHTTASVSPETSDVTRQGRRAGDDLTMNTNTDPKARVSLNVAGQGEPERKRKPAVAADSLSHRDLRSGDFWRSLPAFTDIDEPTFLDHRWQAKHSITKVDKLLGVLEGLVPFEGEISVIVARGAGGDVESAVSRRVR